MEAEIKPEKPPPKSSKALSLLAVPLQKIEARLSSFIRKISSIPGHEDLANVTEEEIHQTLLDGEKSGVVESDERAMVENIFYLGDRPVGAFMDHRSEVLWLDIDADPEEAAGVVEKAKDQHYFPVAAGNLDQISGMVSVEAVLKALLKSPWAGLEAVMVQPYFVPQSMPAVKAFEAFMNAEADCLFVTDEYGGFAGLLTVRDLIEEIVGELSESQPPGEEIVKQEDGSWLADGSVNIDDAARALELEGLGGESNEYHTLAGFILDLAEEIPQTGAQFEYDGYRFTITEMDGNRIGKVRIVKGG